MALMSYRTTSLWICSALREYESCRHIPGQQSPTLHWPRVPLDRHYPLLCVTPAAHPRGLAQGPWLVAPLPSIRGRTVTSFDFSSAE